MLRKNLKLEKGRQVSIKFVSLFNLCEIAARDDCWWLVVDSNLEVKAIIVKMLITFIQDQWGPMAR